MRLMYMLIVILFFVSSALSAQLVGADAFADTLRYGWFSPQDRYLFRDDLSFRSSLIPEFERSMINVGWNMRNSLILPGSGHFHTGNYIRGLIFLGGEIFIASTALFLFERGNTRHEEYRRATQIDDINRLYDEAVDSYIQASLLTGLFVAVWIYNVFDTHLVTREYNRRLWNEHVQREQERRFLLAPNGVMYRF